ncbi:MAG: LptF/LptG family permease [Acidobacteria bacterium]|nr:LptF/LptG family permease [Acidobacteriota bacterium]
MLRLLDRYLVRQALVPFLIGLVLLAFVLEIPVILDQGEKLIEKGVDWYTVVQVLITLLPSSLSIVIPMALLVGILMALGRMSADREFVALQACGVSVLRLLWPIGVLAIAACAFNAWVTIVALPQANQRFREITFGVVASKAQNDVKPRVFFDQFPNRVLYVRDRATDGRWQDVFLADSTQPGQTTVYFAREGRLLVDQGKRTVQLVLTAAARHTTFAAKPDEYETSTLETVVLNLDAETVFPRVQILKGAPEMTIAELRADIAAAAARADPAYDQRLMIQQKFSLPAACLVLALIGLGLGVSHRKDGKLASFVLGFGVVFVYYIIMWTGRSLAKGGQLPAELGPWLPNILIAVAGTLLLAWRVRSADQPIRLTIPAFWRRVPPAGGAPGPGSAAVVQPPPRVVLVVRVPHLNLPRPGLLDLYVARQYLRTFVVAVVSLLGIFYISTFMDLAEKLFRGNTTAGVMLRYFFFQTPQFVYYVIPMAALVSALVTIGLMTKNSELVIMKACGISLYRAAAPLVAFALLASALLFGLQEKVLAYSNREAGQLNRVIRGYPPLSEGALDRRWIVSENGDIYHYDFFDARTNRFNNLSTYQLDPGRWRLSGLMYARQVDLVRNGGPTPGWTARDGWRRTFADPAGTDTGAVKVTYDPFTQRAIDLEPPDYFKTDEPDAERMTYRELRTYVEQLHVSGFNAVPYMVQLQRKIAFPFVTLIMTMLAVPFAVTTGRRGALYGIGIGIVVAIVYWTAMSVFGAIGAAGWIAPMLAAWAPNILFGAVAGYLILSART